ncbi:hypothetical protein RB195_016967 [Necator americanus]|uniref:Uncharacterized protein n=1 Tax=Necator americanus TaxID=51031 RepID=A0ABR1C5G9_NECAM
MFSFWILHGFSNNILPCSLIIQLLRLLPSLQSISFYFRFEVANIILPCLKASPHESDVDDQGDMGGTNPDPAIYNSSLAFPVNAFDQCVYMGCLAYMDTRVLLCTVHEIDNVQRSHVIHGIVAQDVYFHSGFSMAFFNNILPYKIRTTGRSFWTE